MLGGREGEKRDEKKRMEEKLEVEEYGKVRGGRERLKN